MTKDKLYALVILVVSIGVITLSFSHHNEPREIKVHQEVIDTNQFTGDIEDFVEALAMRESSDNYEAVNQFGFMGRYQMGKLALLDVGFTRNEIARFQRDIKNFEPQMQDKAILDYIKVNKHYLRNYFDSYEGTEINGIKITKSGILASAHLVGHKNVVRYLKSGGKEIAKDRNGVSLEEYMELFSNYDMTEIVYI